MFWFFVFGWIAIALAAATGCLTVVCFYKFNEASNSLGDFGEGAFEMLGWLLITLVMAALTLFLVVAGCLGIFSYI